MKIEKFTKYRTSDGVEHTTREMAEQYIANNNALAYLTDVLHICSTDAQNYQKPADAIICPAQLGKTESCGTCGLCWHSRRRIAFLQH